MSSSPDHAGASACVSATRGEAVEAGRSVLEAGGNAVDAVVAMAFVLAVCEPYMTGPGAVGEAVYLTPENRCHVLDAAAIAPLAARPDMYEIAGEPAGVYRWPQTAGRANVLGVRAACAPRLVDGLARLHAAHGRLGWQRLLQPAVDEAARGAQLDFFTTAVLAHEMATLAADPVARALYYLDGMPPRPPLLEPPARVPNGALLETLRGIQANGATPLARGDLATAILDHSERHGGILSAEDLAAPAGLLADVAPLTRYRGWEVYGSPLPSGAVTAAQMLALLELLGEPPVEGPSSPAAYRLMLLAMALAVQDRLTELSGDDPAERCRELLAPERLERLLTTAPAPARGPSHATASSTTHVSASDADGGACSLTLTLLSLFGTQRAVPEGGFCLNNGMMWFDPRPGGTQSIAPGGRSLPAIAPLVLRHPASDRVIAVGGLGNRPTFTGVAQTVRNVVDFGQSLAVAVDHPRVHTDGTETIVDERVDEDVRAALDLAGVAPTRVVHYDPVSITFGRVNGVEVRRSERRASAGIDRRSAATWSFGRLWQEGAP